MSVSDKNTKRFKIAVKQLNKVIKDCKLESKGCFVYLDASNNLSLLSGEFEIGEDGDSESTLAEESLDSGCGDW